MRFHNIPLFIAAVVLVTLCFSTNPAPVFCADQPCEVFVPYRPITKEPGSHWFSYYDKLQFSLSGNYILGMRVDFDNREPKPDDVIHLGMVDMLKEDQWIEFGKSKSWGWQQGCMLQWRPGSASEVLYNDRQGGRFVTVIRNVFNGSTRVLPMPFYAVSPDGEYAVSLNFARLDETRPGYGYDGLNDPWADEKHPKEDGIYLLNLRTAETKLIVSLDQIARTGDIDLGKCGKHWFNHLLFNTDGTRFIFLHRWQYQAGKSGWKTRMFTSDLKGEKVYMIADHDMVSHFIWKNPKEILAWSNEPDSGARFHLYEDLTNKVQIIGEDILMRDGHCTYSPDQQWILVDTYPDKERMQNLMLFRPSDNKLVKLGRFYIPPEFKGQMRCDLHPRWSRDGKFVCIDSLHSGRRQMYLLEVTGIVLNQ